MQDDKSVPTIARRAFALACARLTVGKHTIILATLLVYLGQSLRRRMVVRASRTRLLPIGLMSRIRALSFPRAACKSRTVSISARETAIELLTA